MPTSIRGAERTPDAQHPGPLSIGSPRLKGPQVRIGGERACGAVQVLAVRDDRVRDASPFGVEGREVAFVAAQLGPRDGRVRL